MCGSRLTAGERELCSACCCVLPRVDYRGGEHHGAIERLFWGQVPVERATSMFYYSGANVRRMIHCSKYDDRPKVGRALAQMFAEEHADTDFFDGVDAIVAMPLHWKKYWKRGYNQSDYIAEGLHRATGIPVLKGVVQRIRNNPTQTRLSHIERKENVENCFRVRHPERIEGRHILLVDDVMTTGATLLACATEMARVPNVRFSLFTLAYAHSPVDFLIEEKKPMEYEFHVRPSDFEDEP